MKKFLFVETENDASRSTVRQVDTLPATKSCKRHSFLLIALAMALSSATAQAASVSYFLDKTNSLSLPDGVNYMQVTIDDSSGAPGDINFRVETLAALDAYSMGSSYGMDRFGFNTWYSISAGNIINLPSGWSYGGTGNLNGFGKFNARLGTNGAADRLTTLSFSITGIAGDTIGDYVGYSSGNAGEGNQYFAAHVAGLTCCSGSAYVGGSTVVPVPASVWLFGSGLLGLSGFFRSRSASGRHLALKK